MHLGDGGGGQGRRVETGKDLFRRPAQRSLDLGPQRLEVEGGAGALKLFELGDPVGGQQVRAGGQDLAQLDEGGAQRLQCLTGATRQRLRPVGMGVTAAETEAQQHGLKPEAGGDA